MNGDVYSGGDVDVDGDAHVSGTIRATGAVHGASGEGGVRQELWDALGKISCPALVVRSFQSKLVHAGEVAESATSPR